MKFCTNCDNMLYIGINENDSNKLIYYCRSCGNKEDTITNDGLCVLKTKLKNNTSTFSHIINQYTKLDPTLPRIYSIKCPNNKCSTNHEDAKDPAEIIYMRYDDDNLKYSYICSTCDTIWKTDDISS